MKLQLIESVPKTVIYIWRARETFL